MQQANTPPAYLTVLESYGIELRADDEFALADITSNNPNASLELLYYRQDQWAELVARVDTALTEVQKQQLQLIIVGLTPAASSGTETYAINNLQVPLLISSNLGMASPTLGAAIGYYALGIAQLHALRERGRQLLGGREYDRESEKTAIDDELRY